MTKNRHELPRKKPGRAAKDEIAEELPTLEPVVDELPTLPSADDLPTLEAADEVVDDGPVKITIAAGGEASFDTVVTVEIPAMDKKAVVDAFRPALQRRLAAAVSQLRHRRVLVRFTGDAVVGSAGKEAVAELLKPHLPLLGVVRRGFGDETIAQGKLPEVAVSSAEVGGITKVEVATGELDPIDLPLALSGHLAPLLVAARGKRVTFVFTGKAKPDAALRAQLGKQLQDAGALRGAIGERVLFDLELAQRVQCTVAGDVVTMAVKPAADDAVTIDALSLVLPEHAAACKGRTVRIQLQTAVAKAREFCIDFAKKHGAQRIEVAEAGAESQVVWPKLITATAAGGELLLRLQANGRSRAALLAALQQEAGEHAAAAKGKVVVVDWPAGTAVDGEAETVLHAVLAATGGKGLVATIGGEQREPFAPAPIQFRADGELQVVRVDSEAGKPAELQRAFDRRLPQHHKDLRGKPVRIQIAGSGALSRTLLRSLCGALEAAGAKRLELEESGAVDVLLPPLLKITRTADAVRIQAHTDGRDEAQQAKAMVRELDVAALAAGSSVAIEPSGAAEAIAKVVIGKGAGRVVLAGSQPVQLFPPLFAPVDKKGTAVRLVATPNGDAAMVGRQLERELAAVLAGLGPVANATVTVVFPGADPAAEPVGKLIAGLVGKKPAKVMFEAAAGKAVQVHPPVVVAPPPVPPMASGAVAASAAPAAAAPVAAAVAPGGRLLTVLAKRDDAVPPIVVLGVEAGTEADHLAAVEAQLSEHLPRLARRSVLLVLQRGGQDVPVRKSDALVDLLRRVVSGGAAATLVFRGPDAQGRPHFQVLHSTLRALPVGATFGDPRQRR
ncbi:MAG: hypothetical protein MUC36_06680 [Planctomycetes bacterium]|jgi:hypothetical protein|nr:hypothetical protein [Planctomycetota bacterium]